MIITCTCGAKLKIGDDKLTEAGVRIKCPKCGTAHVAKRPAPAAAEPFTEPAMPWFAPPTSVAPPPATTADMVPASAPKASPASLQKTALIPSSSLVLVAHDSKLVAEMIQGVVKEAGLTVEHATDGLDALKKATTLKPKVMIVDVGLTGIYGFELCERLKGDPETQNIKIILLSSVYGLTAYKRNPITLYGADDYIEKHHIPDRLVPKLKQLLSGQPASVPDLPPDSATAAGEALPVTAGGPGPATTPAVQPTPQVPDAKFAALEVPDVMPKVPVTLDTSRKRATSQASFAPIAPQPKVEVPRALPTSSAPVVAAKAEQPNPEVRRPTTQDESIKLDATFFEQDEYVAPVKAPPKAAVDPEEVEKARRFARLIVSDIVLYNQEAVAEGIAKGTFYDLLNEDITEGRALYEKRVPETIRESKDYYQEAFDNFIAAKKKQR
jgi:predicted Zn finger-like uncharacterized protein